MQTVDKATRLFFLVFSAIIWLGIYLTGFNTVHWFMYLPAVFSLFAAVTGICPGMIISKKIAGKG